MTSTTVVGIAILAFCLGVLLADLFPQPIERRRTDSVSRLTARVTPGVSASAESAPPPSSRADLLPPEPAGGQLLHFDPWGRKS